MSERSDGVAGAKIRAEGVAKTFWSHDRDVVALQPVDLTVADGEFVCILGPSGCGKSTLLRIVAGLIGASAGRVTMDGRPIRGPGPERGLVFQEYALFPWLTVLKNVMYGPTVRGLGRVEAEARARAQIARVGLEGFEQQYPRQLSGGMKQRVGIARVWANQPDVMLMDEPFGALDAITRNILQRDLLKLWLEERHTVLFVTHSVDEAIFLADRVVVMSARPGRITAIVPVAVPRPRDLLAPEAIALKAELTRLVEDQVMGPRGEPSRLREYVN
ncbi:nitrate ABC transporter ATP-binding protein [Rhodoplanes elegans]|uniref:Nitrate ABC transporter ATP-binding protein n=1 Tax=Rhodoplanes elegans TaxID=29408 RepID=A0A327K9I3_9BRAD|nr:ABC transporter ATP-binding protein [Rhodoplanes elegans]MBK5957150.1 nitrate ABC transporter ATP-binding protein [Rhodoplanes elegans]RAI35087.1 nitrate ABC transporter ATP-binding protein [Rhodoplanes elegans]